MATTPLSRITAWALARRPVRAYLRYAGSRGPMLADSVTYRTLFSLFAAVLLGFSIASLWLAGNPDAWAALVSALDSVIPGLVGPGAVLDLSNLDSAPAGLTIAGIVSTVGLIGAAIGAIGSLRSALRTIARTGQDDVLIVWALLRNLGLAIGLGAGLVAAAVATFIATAGLGLLTGWLGLSDDEPWVAFVAWLAAAVVVFALDTAVVAALVAVLSGVKPRGRTLWAGAMVGGLGLTVLQQLSGLFVGGATSNPLLGVFASFIALLLWLNFSSQVILIAGAYIVTAVEDEDDRARDRRLSTTLAQYQVREGERLVQEATDHLDRVRAIEEKERVGATSPPSAP